MKKSKFTEAQITFVLKQAKDGMSVAVVCRKAGIVEATFYNWRKKYGGLMPSEIKRLKMLDEENAGLKRLVADLSLDKAICRTLSNESSQACSSSGTGERATHGLGCQHPTLMSCVAIASFDLQLSCPWR